MAGMDEELPPAEDTKKPRRNRAFRRKGEQDAPDNTNGFAAYAAAEFAGSNEHGSMKGIKLKGGRFSGKTKEEAYQELRKEYAGMGDEDKMRWEGIGRGDDLRTGANPTPQLPPSLRGAPNAPDLSGPNASRTAAARYQAMNADSAARAGNAGVAVAARKEWQAANPEAVADMSIAANDDRLAKSGITDMGGGYRAMDNKYGTGIATPATPGTMPFGPGRTGVIRDENGAVDMQALGKGELAYVPNAAPPVAAYQENIQSTIAEAAPGAMGRRAADREKVIASLPPAMAPKQQVAIATPAAPSAEAAFQQKPATPFPGRNAPVGNTAAPTMSPYAQRFMPSADKAAMIASQKAAMDGLPTNRAMRPSSRTAASPKPTPKKDPSIKRATPSQI